MNDDRKPVVNSESSNLALQIRKLSPKFSYQDRNEMLYGLGATTVHNWPYFSVAFFPDESGCHMAIRLLHQRTLNNKRLRVEFAKPDQIRRLPVHTACDDYLRNKINESQLDAFAKRIKRLKQTDLGANRIPQASSTIVDRISQTLLNNEQFYHQVVLLMKQNGLNLPFENESDEFLASIPLPSNDEETELETVLNSTDLNQTLAPKFVLDNRKRKRPALKTGLVGDNADEFSGKKKKVPEPPRRTAVAAAATIEEMFDDRTPDSKLLGGKPLIKIRTGPTLPEDDDNGESNDQDETTIESPPQPVIASNGQDFDVCLLTKQDLITDEQLNHNRLPESQWCNHSVLDNYSAGVETNRLFVKNLHRKVSLKDLYLLFAKFIDLGNHEHLNKFNIKLFTKGRMKGQAFVTYPLADQARNALQSTNGYCYLNKPMVVVYSRSLATTNDS